jgi:Icc-related predicted phosphoesterase
MAQFRWLNATFKPWAEQFSRFAWVAGNHDFVCENRALVPSIDGYLQDSSADYLFNSFNSKNKKFKGTAFSHLSVWGTPWSLPYGTWAFMAEEGHIARRLKDYMSRQCEILVSHGPPYGIGDKAPRINRPAGSRALANVIETAQPLLAVVGHIHEGRGVYTMGRTTVVNAAMMSDSPRKLLAHPPIIISLSDESGGMAVTSVDGEKFRPSTLTRALSHTRI